MSRLKAKCPGKDVIVVELGRGHHPPPPARGPERRQIQPVEEEEPGLRLPQPGEQRRQRGLPAARRALPGGGAPPPASPGCTPARPGPRGAPWRKTRSCASSRGAPLAPRPGRCVWAAGHRRAGSPPAGGWPPQTAGPPGATRARHPPDAPAPWRTFSRLHRPATSPPRRWPPRRLCRGPPPAPAPDLVALRGASHGDERREPRCVRSRRCDAAR